MATWNELNAEVRDLGTTYDIVRREYLRRLADRTGRNTVPLPYSVWLGGQGHPMKGASDGDTIGLAIGLIENQDGRSFIQAAAG